VFLLGITSAQAQQQREEPQPQDWGSPTLDAVLAPPEVSVSAAPTSGAAPLLVNLAVQCDTCASYRWDWGDPGNKYQVAGANQWHTYNSPGSFTATVTGTDQQGQTATASIVVNVMSLVPLGENDYCAKGDVWIGPKLDRAAHLPVACIYTGLDGSPSTGNKIIVSEATITALNLAASAATCGDTILIPASFEAQISTWTLPARPCDADSWITIRTAAEDSELPPEHTRLTPCYAGLASLPERPAYPCPNVKRVIPKLYAKGSADVISFAAGANHYRFIGLEIARTPGTGINYGLIETTGADHIIFDRMWIHGSDYPEDSKNGVFLADSTNIAIVNSYMTEFKCGPTACVDGHAVSGADGVLEIEGVWKFYNNFVEASTENMLFGGSTKGVATPTDLEVRLNHFFKRPSWNPKHPDFVPPTTRSKGYIVKNLFELKNAQRVLFEGNYGEYSWGGFSQTGWSMVLTSRGSWAAVADVTIRFNKFSHVGSGFQLIAALTPQPRADSKEAARWSLHDNVIDDMDADFYLGSGQAFSMISEYTARPPLNNVTISHNTFFNYTPQPGNMFNLGVEAANPQKPFQIQVTDNIMRAAKYSVWSTGKGTCVVSGKPWTTFTQCYDTFHIANNVLAGYADPKGPSQGFFPGNYQTTDPMGSMDSIQFVNWNNGKDGDYHLQPTSPYHNMASDGTDLGANIDAVNQAVKLAY
jgi:hypothetical protein